MDSIIFDVDGTLWDSTAVVADAWNEVVQTHTSLDPFITSDRLQSLFGKTMPEIANDLFPSETKEKQRMLMDLCCEKELQFLKEHNPVLYPDIPHVIKTLALRYPLFIVSNCQAGYIEAFLDCTGLYPYIKDHLCPGDTGRAKAENIREIIHRHHLSSPIYVGDTEGDYRATKSAGDSIPFVFASYGFGNVDAPDYTIARPLDMLTMF